MAILLQVIAARLGTTAPKVQHSISVPFSVSGRNRMCEEDTMIRPLSLLLLLLAAVAIPADAQQGAGTPKTQVQAGQQEVPAANPGRPTVATPATLTPVGYLQFECGFLGASDSPGLSSQYSFDEVMKLTVTPRLQFLVSTEPIARSTSQNVSTNGTGDVSLGVQGVLYQGEGTKPTVAVAYFHRVYGGDAPDLDIESQVNSLQVLASADVKGFHYDANAFFAEVAEVPVRRAQYGEAFSVSHPFLTKFTLSGEIWNFTQPFLNSNAVGNLWGISYTVRRNFVLDVAFNRGLTATSTRWEATAGFTYLLPQRLWPAHRHR
jgi:hypothetical protein